MSSYWEARYGAGGNSGIGSYGHFALFKSEIINAFVKENSVRKVIEFGCGDGNQLSLMEYPDYTGIDVSETAVAICRSRFAGDPTKRFALAGSAIPDPGEYDLALSLDVIFHLTEDAIFDRYMHDLFAASSRFVIIYSSNGDPANGTYDWPPHVRHRCFTQWIARNAVAWRLVRHIPNRYPFYIDAEGEHGSFADFHVFEKSETATP